MAPALPAARGRWRDDILLDRRRWRRFRRGLGYVIVDDQLVRPDILVAAWTDSILDPAAASGEDHQDGEAEAAARAHGRSPLARHSTTGRWRKIETGGKRMNGLPAPRRSL
jgi:hypothetical protein